MNHELDEGYLPIIKTVDGLLIGEGVIANNNDVWNVFAIDITCENLEIKTSPQKLVWLEYCNLPEEESDEDPIDGDYILPEDKQDQGLK